MRVPTAASRETCCCRGSGMSLSVPGAGVGMAFRSRDALPNGSCETSEHRTGVKVPNCGGRCYKTSRLLAGPCQALGADTPRDAELRGDLACRRLGSERKYVKRIYA